MDPPATPSAGDQASPGDPPPDVLLWPPPMLCGLYQISSFSGPHKISYNAEPSIFHLACRVKSFPTENLVISIGGLGCDATTPPPPRPDWVQGVADFERKRGY